jgi:4-aminobutyrate--pyruvate transaminase
VGTVALHFERRLRSYQDHPLVGDVRCLGLMGAIEMVADKRTRAHFEPAGSVAAALRERAEAEGVLTRACQCGDTLAFCPPLVITESELDELFDRFDRALEATSRAVAKATRAASG